MAHMGRTPSSRWRGRDISLGKDASKPPGAPRRTQNSFCVGRFGFGCPLIAPRLLGKHRVQVG